jgi:antitoxin component YwqK of YwqJK toxin-antitoxin module
MRIVFAFCFVFVAQWGIAQQNRNINSITRIYSEDGYLQMTIAYEPACTCKTYTEFYSDGKIFAKRTFKLTEKGEYIDGDDITYYHDGSIKIYKFWKNTVPDGRAYTNYENGKLEHEEFYVDKYKSGTWKYYNKKGELIKELVYEPRKTSWNSKKEDVTMRYYADGKLSYSEVYDNGKKIQSTKKGGEVLLVGKAPETTDGKQLFVLKCSACHSEDKDGFGPALKDVTKKRNNEWLFMMIKNGQKLVDEGDKDAVALYNKWRKMKHPNMEKLSNKQIQAIIDYLKTMK